MPFMHISKVLLLHSPGESWHTADPWGASLFLSAYHMSHCERTSGCPWEQPTLDYPEWLHSDGVCVGHDHVIFFFILAQRFATLFSKFYLEYPKVHK